MENQNKSRSRFTKSELAKGKFTQRNTVQISEQRKPQRLIVSIKNISEAGITRLAPVKSATAQQRHDLTIFANANYTGPTLRKIPADYHQGILDSILIAVTAMNGLEPLPPQVMQLVTEAVVESFGHLRPEEIKFALVQSLLGKIPDAPRTFQKINLEWIGGVLTAYEAHRDAAMARAKKILPERSLPEPEKNPEEINEYFGQLMAACVNESEIPIEAKPILPEIFEELEKYIEANLQGILKMCDKRRIELYKVAGDIIKSKDERAAVYEATKKNFFNATLMRHSQDKTRNQRQLRLAKEMACRELLTHLHKYGIKIPC